MKTVGIIGGSGYVAGELIRCLSLHPKVKIDFIYSHSEAGKSASEIHDDLYESDFQFTDKINPEVDVVFLCLGHGNSKTFLSNHQFCERTKIIDLSNDFRLKKDAYFEGKPFCYGLVENQFEEIQNSQFIANPGCFATAIQLALLPLAKNQLITDEVHVHAITGSTGAGKNPNSTSHFSWRNNNVSIYKAFNHQHLGEIKETLNALQKDEANINFIPMRGNFTRGILASVYTKCELSESEIQSLFKNFYQESPFTIVSDQQIHLKQVVNTNKCILQVEKHHNKVHITSIIDNLLKGAAGQAIQNMNIMCGWEQTAGLNYKPSYF